ncbi:hypothetical protein BBJ29_001000 [Phytophthora kernoviae]|uniref:Kinesin motor domain-containing protein n=1 Tax=Phytophthora kernoviae TaxID=325452 RepID=A0A3F2S4G8_9STRA|nr:hypothetical protein BBJ29_001000 [Phytophthora kernoviae]RLN69284.1 hypothetical protein BBP00_00000461 [Phytophthora kernoviae]
MTDVIDTRRMSSSSSSSGQDAAPIPMPTNVQVAVRCRPLNSREKATGRGAVVQCKQNSNEVAVVKRKTYTFDRVFGQYSTQKDVFSSVVKPAVDEALAGYNCTVFAYGQTGTGKTYTMQGDLKPGSETAGIIPRSVRRIFEALEAKGEEFSVRVSFLQLYNEELKDLLDPDGDKKLRLMEDTKRGGIYCLNLLEVTATTAKHVFELVNTGVKNRITSETLMNENSSRSHSIFTIRIHSKEHNAAGEDLLRVGQLNLVDLAGSECVGRSGARNARAREAGTINQSLLTLGRVITALVDNLPHVPYRDSKLTRLLQESLGGRAKTTIIATLAPCADSLDETLSTLEYAFRAKSIKNKPELNQKMTKAGLLNDFGNEIETLRAALRAARLKDGVYLPLEQFADMQERLAGQGVQDNEQVLITNGATATKLYNASETSVTQLLVKIVHSTDLNGLTASLNALQVLVEARRAQTTEALAEDESQKREQREDMTKSMDGQKEAMQAQLERFVEMSKSHAAAIAADLATSKNRNMSFLENVQSTLEGSREELGNFLSEQSDKLLELQVAIDISIEKQTKLLDENKAALMATLKNSHAQQEEELNGVKAKLAEYVDKCIQSQTQKLGEQTLLIEENAKQQQKDLTYVQTMTEQEMNGFVQAMGQQNSKHENETAGLRERFSDMRGKLDETNAQQTELVQSHERLQTVWSEDTVAFVQKHKEEVAQLMEHHSQADVDISSKRHEQISQFLGDHEDLRQLLSGGCKTLEDGLQTHLSSTNDKIKSASDLGGKLVGDATEDSTQHLEDMEMYMKKRRVNERTGETPMKKDNRRFPSFQATKVADDDKTLMQNTSSIMDSLTVANRKRRRLSDVSSSPIGGDAPAVEGTPVQTQRIPAETSIANVSSLESTGTSPASALGSSATTIESKTKTPAVVATKAAAVATTTPGVSAASKFKKTGSTVTNKKPAIAHPHRSLKVPSAGGRKSTKMSALAAPKRYRAKSPLSESSTNLLDSIISAFMNAPQVDGRNARVPVDLSVTSKKARARVHAKQNEGAYWAAVPQLPVTASSMYR